MISSYVKIIAGIVVAVLVAGAAALGYQHGYTVADTAGKLALEQYRSQQSAAAAEAASSAFGKYADQVTHAGNAETKFLTVQDKHDDQATINKGKIDAVAQPHRPLPATQSGEVVYQCVFTRDFVRLWNSAAGLTAGNRTLQGGTNAGGADENVDADGSADSGVSQADILDWFIDYAKRSRNTESQLKALIHALPPAQ